MEWLLILTIKYYGDSIAITSVRTPSIKACTKAGSSWKVGIKSDFDSSAIDTSFTCSPMIKDK